MIDTKATTVDVLGYKIEAGSPEQVTKAAFDWLNEPRAGLRYVACANPHSIVVATEDHRFHEALCKAGMLLPDGAGIVLAAKLQGTPVYQRIAGSEFFERICGLAQEKGGVRFFFLGSSPEVLEKICSRLSAEYPRVMIAGTYSPPFKSVFSPEDNRHMVELVNASGADVLWVGMTAPKQEKWLLENAADLNAPLGVAIGAVFDFYSGNKKRAPEWVRRLGLEWLPRLVREPARLWRRNFVSSPKFLFSVIKERLKSAT